MMNMGILYFRTHLTPDFSLSEIHNCAMYIATADCQCYLHELTLTIQQCLLYLFSLNSIQIHVVVLSLLRSAQQLKQTKIYFCLLADIFPFPGSGLNIQSTQPKATGYWATWWHYGINRVSVYYVYSNPDRQRGPKTMTLTWLEHAAFWSGVRRATIAPQSHIWL